MKEIKLVIKTITEIRKLLIKSSGAQKDQQSLISSVNLKLSELKHLLHQEDVRISIDKALIEIHEKNDRFKKNQDAEILLSKPSKEFLDFEMRLYDSLGIKRKELEQLSAKTKACHKETMDDEYRLSSKFFPSNSSELFSIIELQTKTSIDDIQNTKSLPRKAKKKMKLSVLGRFWLGTVGTGLALGDVALALSSIALLTENLAIASIKIGMGSLTAAVLGTPNVLKQLRGKQDDDSESAT